MSRGLTQGLRARGIDVLTVLDAGLAGQDEHALQHACALFTFNVGHFCRLHSGWLELGKIHAGIVVVPRQRLTIGEQVRALARLTSETSSEQMVGRLIFLKA